MFNFCICSPCNPAINQWPTQDFQDVGGGGADHSDLMQKPIICRLLWKTALNERNPIISLGYTKVESTSGPWRRRGVIEVNLGIYYSADPCILRSLDIYILWVCSSAQQCKLMVGTQPGSFSPKPLILFAWGPRFC